MSSISNSLAVGFLVVGDTLHDIGGVAGTSREKHRSNIPKWQLDTHSQFPSSWHIASPPHTYRISSLIYLLLKNVEEANKPGVFKLLKNTIFNTTGQFDKNPLAKLEQYMTNILIGRRGFLDGLQPKFHEKNQHHWEIYNDNLNRAEDDALRYGWISHNTLLNNDKYLRDIIKSFFGMDTPGNNRFFIHDTRLSGGKGIKRSQNEIFKEFRIINIKNY